jgi:hypothetical protein
MKYLFAFIVLIFSSDSVFSCSCYFQEGSLEENVASSLLSASAVVWAKAESTENIEPYEERVWSENNGERKNTLYRKQRTHFSVIESWKGMHEERFITEIEVVCCVCGYRFKDGEEYLLYLSGPNDDGYYHASSCSRTKKVTSQFREEIDILRKMAQINAALGI